jgi:hypothetical protein
MIVINFILKVILKTLLVAAWLWPITLPLGYCVAVGMVLGWDNMREAGVGLMLILPAIVVFNILRWDYRRGGGDGKFNTMAESINVGFPTKSLNVVSKDVVIFIQLSTSIPSLCKIGG